MFRQVHESMLLATVIGLMAVASPIAAAEPKGKSAKSVQACVYKWTKAYRKEKGDKEALVNADQLSEWEQWCKEGKNLGK